MRNTFIQPLVFIIVLLVAPGVAPAQDYEIRLSYQPKVGEKYRFAARGSHAEVMSILAPVS